MLTYFEMFAGYGGASFALKRLDIQSKCIGFSEIDSAAISCYLKNFPTIKNFGDCVNINPLLLPDFDLLTGGFPCQDVSIAGKGNLSKGRTTLFDEIIRIAEVKKPQYIFLENVKGILSETHKKFYTHVKSELSRIGYIFDEPKIFNSKHYGIPQSRERIFFMCVRDESLLTFNTPSRKNLGNKLKEILEKKVDKKYYLFNHKKKNTQLIIKTPHPSDEIKCVGIIPESIKPKGNYFPRERIFSPEGIYRTLTTSLEHQPWILESGIKLNPKKIRRLTPLESFRLMGFKDGEIDFAGLTDNELYKLAGNGWDINLVSIILKEFLKNEIC